MSIVLQVSSLLPSNRNRSLLVHSLISAFRLTSIEHSNGQMRLQVLKPTQASDKDLYVYHSRDYIDYVLDAANSGRSDTLADSELEVTAEFGLEDVRLNLHYRHRYYY